MGTVVVGLLGTKLDRRGPGPKRWASWRPTVSLFGHDDLLVDRLELLHAPEEARLAEHTADDVRQLSPGTDVRLVPLPLDDPWDFEEVFAALHAYARTAPLDPEDDDVLVHITTGTHVAQICLFLLTESRHLPGRLVQTSPGPRYAIIDLDLSRYDALAQRHALEQAEAASFLKDGVQTRDPVFNRMIDEIERVAVASDAPILMLGPTGAGKTRLARRLHALRRARGRVRGELVEVNCATLRGDQAMSALFGHVRGAFTGAEVDRAGLLRRAHGGMLFLDEVGELGADEQAMLLRAIETGTFLPVGSDVEATSSFQLVCGSNRPLRPPAFRADLRARIDLWTFALPGLAARRADIAPNLDHELARHAARTGHAIRMTRDARRRWLKFAESAEATWPASFRDLTASVTRMATLAEGGRITAAVADQEVARLRARWGADDPLGALVSGPLDRFDAVQLADVVTVCRDARTISDAGRALFAVSREKRRTVNDADRLRKYLARFGLEFDALRGG